MRFAILLALALGGCTVTDGRERVVATEYYTKADVDAINAEMQCRQIARTLVQAQRCGVRR